MDERNINYYLDIEKNKETMHKRKIKALLARVGLLATLLVLSTYAWFTSQKDITLSNIRGTVEVVENMEISLDAKTWYQKIDLADAETVFTTAQDSRDEALGETSSTIKSTALTILPEQLFPVSGVGKTGVTLLPLYVGEATSTSLSGISVCEEKQVIDGVDAAKDNGYIAFDMYIKNTSRDNEKDILQLNINSSAQVLTETINKTITDVVGNRVNREYYGNDASGLQNTIRVALAKYEGEITSTATQLEILNSTKDAKIADVAIWEPNAYDHVESIVSNNNKLINATNDNRITFTEYHPDEDLETYALTENAVNQTIENVYDIASTGLGAQNTFKTDNIKSVNFATDGTIESYRIKTTNNKPLNIKNTNDNDFEISANTVTRYRVYIWLEGQDVDCINIASLGGGIELDLGLTKDDEVGDVIEEIDSRVTYSEIDEVTNKVTATITMNKVITVLPSGWEYTDETKKAIKKEYDSYIIEQVEIKTEDGIISKIEVTIDEFESVDGPFSTELITDYGLVDVIWLDGDTNNVSETPNEPDLYEELGDEKKLTPVTWTYYKNGITVDDKKVNWKVDDTPQTMWYNYSAEKGNDGKEDNTTSMWANAKNVDGSYFVWLPRYAYRITYYADPSYTIVSGYYDGDGLWNPFSGIKKYELDEGIETITYNEKSYIVHPAFADDTSKTDSFGNALPDYDRGGWDKDLTGIWVAKYEMSREGATSENSGSGYSTNFLSVPNVKSAGNIAVGNMYQVSKSYDTEKESHMLKNSEWGAVAFLAQSQYGRNGHEVSMNNANLTGGGENTTEEYDYNTVLGAKSSTTGNVYGIYDMAGGLWEHVAGFNKLAELERLTATSRGGNMTKEAKDSITGEYISTKYVTAYSNADRDNVSKEILYEIGKAGDATKEVRSLSKEEYWYNDYSKFVAYTVPYYGRGGSSGYGDVGGIFYSDSTSGNGYDSVSFRISLGK